MHMGVFGTKREFWGTNSSENRTRAAVAINHSPRANVLRVFPPFD